MANLENQDYFEATENATEAINANQLENQYPEIDQNMGWAHDHVDNVMLGNHNEDMPSYEPYSMDNQSGAEEDENADLPAEGAYQWDEEDDNQMAA